MLLPAMVPDGTSKLGLCLGYVAQAPDFVIRQVFQVKRDKLFRWPISGHLDSRFSDRGPSQNLNPDVLMMESAEDWYRCDGAELLRAPKIRRILVQ